MDTRQFRLAWPDPGSQHHLVKRTAGQLLGGGGAVQFERHLFFGQATPEVTQHLVKLGFARYLARQAQLAARLGTGFKQRHLMTTLGGVEGEVHARRTRTHHGNALGCGCRLCDPIQLTARTWVH